MNRTLDRRAAYQRIIPLARACEVQVLAALSAHEREVFDHVLAKRTDRLATIDEA
jgi:hypothetical protein